MNIYIYGNKDFKKEINELIKHSNLKFRMNDDDEILELTSLNELKETILNTPEDIFLIDESKIYTNNLLNKNLKFLKAKDSIDKEFLVQNGIGDINVDSLDALGTYLISKYKDVNEKDSNDFEEIDEIQSSIIDIVEDAYNENEENIKSNNNSENEIDEEYLKLDDDLSSLLSRSPSEESKEEEYNLSTKVQSEEKLDDILLELDKKDDSIIHISEIEDLAIKGEEMNIDDLNESDILSALSLDVNNLVSTNSNNERNLASQNNNSFKIDLNNADDLAKLLKELSQNKTLEITVKVI